MAFIDTFIAMRNGGAAIECEQALEQVVEAVRKTGKQGKLTLTILVKPADKGPDIDTIFLQDQVKADAPKPDKKLTLFFADPKNQLSRNDTRQFNMLDEVEPINLNTEDAHGRR